MEITKKIMAHCHVLITTVTYVCVSNTKVVNSSAVSQTSEDHSYDERGSLVGSSAVATSSWITLSEHRWLMFSKRESWYVMTACSL